MHLDEVLVMLKEKQEKEEENNQLDIYDVIKQIEDEENKRD
tara:strand:+ start:502 stop:624 length:123 start_codon:yes stop_codon:yes gene_type:complete